MKSTVLAKCQKGMGFYTLLVLVGLTAQLVSCADFKHNVECGPTDTVCECDADATVCSFQFYVEYVFTIERVENACMETLSKTESNLYCNEENVCIEKSKLCTDPITVDGKTYKMLIAVNKQFPGPTLIVHEGQIVAVDVHNNLSTEGISIHWHGQHQIKTNFMDGVGLVTQCPIQPGSSFRYIFRVEHFGTTHISGLSDHKASLEH